jgi:hypothetical protein
VANRLAKESFAVTVAGPPVHDDWVTAGALRDSASQTVLAAPGMFQTTQLTYGQIPNALVGYLAVYPAGP